MSNTCIVTGCCGLIGGAIVDDLISSGYHVFGLDINEQALDQLTLKYSSTQFTQFYFDLTSDSSYVALENFLFSLDQPVANAVHAAYPRSTGWGKCLADLTSLDLTANLSSQLGGAILFSRFILQYFSRHNGGSLIHISSIQGISAPKFEHYDGLLMSSPVEYSAIKAGIISITKWFAKYFSSSNIRVNCVSPGGVLDNQDPLFLKRYRDSCTNKGMLDPSDVSSVVKYLLSKDAYAINGQNFVVDDGWSL